MSYQTIEDARKELGLSQDDMASKLGIVRQTYAKLERNPENLTVGDARRICDILGKKLADIIFLSVVNLDSHQEA